MGVGCVGVGRTQILVKDVRVYIYYLVAVHFCLWLCHLHIQLIN
jgi:hypothetical protein